MLINNNDGTSAACESEALMLRGTGERGPGGAQASQQSKKLGWQNSLVYVDYYK